MEGSVLGVEGVGKGVGVELGGENVEAGAGAGVVVGLLGLEGVATRV